jgi:hypothetical protein
MKLNLRTIQGVIALGLSATLLGGDLATRQPEKSPAMSARIVRSLGAATVAATNSAAGVKANAPREMKLLVVALDGNEPDYAALKFYLDTLGIPYQTAITLKRGAGNSAPSTFPLPALTDSTGAKGLFQGIILTDGNLGYCYGPSDSPTCESTLSPADWATLENYCRDFGVRLVSYYTYPEARYGLAFDHAVAATDANPLYASFTAAAAPVFPYLNTANPVKLANSYVYYATPAPGAGETTTPILNIGTFIAASINTKPDGREYLALTMNNSPQLLHSLILNYGILNWVTKGVFIGGRKIYIAPQVDDLFLSNDLYVQGIRDCTPTGFVTDPTYVPVSACPTLRITGGDLKALADWQKSWNANPQFQRFRVTHAFNGLGSVNDAGNLLTNDELIQQTRYLRGTFYWVNHTWDHRDLDCYNRNPNAGVKSCVDATYSQSADEIVRNTSNARALTLPLDRASMVTPRYSGLDNSDFLKAAAGQGIRYLVSDASYSENLPAIPNTGFVNPLEPSILMIPRRPANLFYNTVSGIPGVSGSLVDEYNFFYGPDGYLRVGGSGDQAFFATSQSYAEIVDHEADNLLNYMLRYELYPQMFHQSNLSRFDANRSLFSDVHDAAFAKFAKISNLPVISLTETGLGREVEAKMSAVAGQVNGTLTPGQSISLTGTAAARVTLTGVCFGTECESYGGQCLSKVSVTASALSTIPITAVTNNCAANPGLADTGGPSVVPLDPNSATSYALARLAGDQLTAARDLPNLTDSDAARLDSASSAINDSLDPSLWLDSSRLLTPDGQAFFAAQQNAALTLMSILSDAPAVTTKAVLNSMGSLNRKLAAAAIAAAETGASSASTTAIARKELENGDSSLAVGKCDEAISHYASAWSIAESAIDDATGN